MKQTDQKTIKEAKKLLKELKIKRGGNILEFHKKMANDPGLLTAFSQMYSICNQDMRHIPRKYRELIFMAIGCAKNASTTVNVHAQLALKNGATMDEIGETLRIVFLLCGVTGLFPGLEVLEAIEDE